MKGSLLIFLSNAAGKMHFELSPQDACGLRSQVFVTSEKNLYGRIKPDRFYMQRKNASKTTLKNSMHFLIHNFYNFGKN